MRSMAGLAMGIAIFISPGMGQKPTIPPGGGGPPGGSPGSRNNGGLPNPTTTGPNYPDLNRGIFLSGKVIMQDGTPPPEPVTIERVCSASPPRAQAYTDSRGHFSFLMGQTSGMMQDASEGGASAPGVPQSQSPMDSSMGRITSTNRAQAGGFGSYDWLANCDLRASLAGYRSDTVNLNGRRVFDNPDVGTIILHRLGNVEGSVISLTSLQAPKDAKKAYDKAREALKKERLPEAEKDLQKAVDIYPAYAAAWFELGRIQQRKQDIEQARQCYEKALAADPKFTSPYLQLAELAAVAQKWHDLADISDRILKLDPVDYPMAYLYNAVSNLYLERIDAAEKSARAGQKLDTLHQCPKLDRVLAMVLKQKKDYAGAVEQMRNYVQLAPAAEVTPRMRKELADLESLSGANQQAATAPASKSEPSASGPPQPPQ